MTKLNLLLTGLHIKLISTKLKFSFPTIEEHQNHSKHHLIMIINQKLYMSRDTRYLICGSTESSILYFFTQKTKA